MYAAPLYNWNFSTTQLIALWVAGLFFVFAIIGVPIIMAVQNRAKRNKAKKAS